MKAVIAALAPIAMEIMSLGATVAIAGWLVKGFGWGLFGSLFVGGVLAHIPFVGKIVAIIAVICAFNWNPCLAIIVFAWHYVLLGYAVIEKNND